MSVAVLIVNFHVYDDLDRTLRTLAPQLAPDDEVVVVDQESDTARLGALGWTPGGMPALREALATMAA